MGVSPLVAVVAVIVFFIAISLIWWLRYQQKKTVARRVSRQPHPYLGPLANHIYQIPMRHGYIYQTPPPTFSKAVKFPIPKNRISMTNVQFDEEAPPPSYDQYVKAQEKKVSVTFIPTFHQEQHGKVQEKEYFPSDQKHYCEFI